MSWKVSSILTHPTTTQKYIGSGTIIFLIFCPLFFSICFLLEIFILLLWIPFHHIPPSRVTQAVELRNCKGSLFKLQRTKVHCQHVLGSSVEKPQKLLDIKYMCYLEKHEETEIFLYWTLHLKISSFYFNNSRKIIGVEKFVMCVS